MVTFLITSVLVFSILAIAIYFWQKPANKTETIDLPPAYPPAIFFSDLLPTPELAAPENKLKSDLLARGKTGDFSVLLEVNDPEIYAEVLDAVVSSQTELVTLALFVAEKDLRANGVLVNAFIQSWEANPNSQATARLLHLAARSDNPDVFDNAVHLVLTIWREGKLTGVSTTDLQALFNKEFWVLSSAARNSGAGFILKRTLSSARRELEGITN